MSHTDPENVVGRSAHVMLPIPGDDKPGEVLIAVRGGSEMFIVYCDQPVPAGASCGVSRPAPNTVSSTIIKLMEYPKRKGRHYARLARSLT